MEINLAGMWSIQVLLLNVKFPTFDINQLRFFVSGLRKISVR